MTHSLFDPSAEREHPHPNFSTLLDDADAIAVGLDPDQSTYTQLADLATATDKARRDAPAIAVCEL